MSRSDNSRFAPVKPLLSALRALLARTWPARREPAGGAGVDASEAIDAGIDRAARKPGRRGADILSLDSVTGGSGVPRIRRTERPAGRPPRVIGVEGKALIKRFEGCAKVRRDGLIEAYPDPGTGGEPWTIGWGATGAGLKPGERIGPGTVWTQAQCDERLERDLERYAREVAEALGAAPTSQNQFDALVSFHYNTGAIARATLTRRHIAGDHEGAASEFKRWNRAGGRVLKGLVRRRAAEERLYRGTGA